MCKSESDIFIIVSIEKKCELFLVQYFFFLMRNVIQTETRLHEKYCFYVSCLYYVFRMSLKKSIQLN